MSTTNASEERKRHLRAGKYRLAATMAIQPEFAHDLMDDNSTAQGFTGRLLFQMATSPVPDPDHRPAWPGVLDVAVPPTSPGELAYDSEIVREVRWNDHHRRQDAARDPLDAHRDLTRLKVAGLLALADGHMFVSGDDWSIATALLDTNRVVRLHLKAFHAQHQRDQRHSLYRLQAEREDFVQDERERKAIAALAARIRAHVPPDGVGQNELRKDLTSSKTKQRFAPAVTLAVQNAWIKVAHGRIERM